LAANQSLYHLPLTLADQLGYFRQAGVVGRVVGRMNPAPRRCTSALQGQADVVAGAFDHVFGLQVKGLSYQAFVQIGRTPQVSLGVASRLEACVR
jgi:NitT/TauT family transport system substrate-binding protein